MGTFSTSAKNTSNELSGGSPAYARKNITVNAASGGVRALNADMAFDVMPASTVAYVGYWASGPTFLGSDPVTNEVFAAQGTYTLLASGTTFDLTG